MEHNIGSIPISIPIQIRFADIDLAKHVHNAVYLHWFELARMALFRSFIPDDHDWLKTGLILARNEIDHRMPVLLQDQIVVEAWCNHIGTRSMDLGYAVIRTHERSGICAEGRSVMVCFDLQEQKSIAIPEEWKAGLRKHQRK